MRKSLSYALAAAVLLGAVATPSAQANNAWSPYHWARTSNPFTLKTVDSVTSGWDSYLDTAISDWSASSVLNLTKEAGLTGSTDRRRCKPEVGKMRVCNYTYGNNGWLGLAQIWVSGSHITQGTSKMNDTYFNTSTYNTTGWKSLVMCQEPGHVLGLGHQDEDFNNPPIVPHTCMDYFVPGTNEVVHPNQHDYDMLDQIYTHLDTTTTVGAAVPGNGRHLGVDMSEPGSWGKVVREAASGKNSLYERDLGGGHKVFTFVIWAE